MVLTKKWEPPNTHINLKFRILIKHDHLRIMTFQSFGSYKLGNFGKMPLWCKSHGGTTKTYFKDGNASKSCVCEESNVMSHGCHMWKLYTNKDPHLGYNGFPLRPLVLVFFMSKDPKQSHEGFTICNFFIIISSFL